MSKIKEEITMFQDELIELRRDFHRHPELGYQEFRTSKIVYDYLLQLGLEVKMMTKTGVVGLLRGNHDGNTVLLRADMDALSQEEKTGLTYQSKTQGIMHACGHDGHTAMLMMAAKILVRHKEEIKGNVKFVFQPNEEEAGALNMIQAGVLENPVPVAAFGLHLWTPIESGRIGLATGPIMACTEEFEITIIGKAGHTSAPHTALDPILVAATVIQSLQSIQTREVDPLLPITIMVGNVHGGSGRNIIADKVEIGGTIRFLFKNEETEKIILLEKFERVIKGICEGMGVQYYLKFIPSNPSLYNDKSMVNYVKQAAVETFGKEDNIVEYRCMAGEDFAEFTHRVPSAFYFVGTGNVEKNSQYPHHHPMFNIDEDTLKIGVEMHVRSVLNFLAI
ncbi:M20 family metallopeptidase [Desulfosporosinus sp. BICA1-9]|uniref:M20 metallopeptidase family protein n=1 Tax=Desulfosporosinus sp. BICA1-9 TaxID=1531958 RepID=UPI00054AFFD3|nr:amidohydrolase [Desulfosporosinus sp. BICA1-9]KJS48364.1 MAG: peptidase M20 [Peptococcaceae bacterium BRH_c23]KJS86854.1 MAG: peptidase M20 [Desulfosporosinus sp. BICA1-9]HBW34189.1 amidohydrolase [Desulfosporosinus sp.]